MKDRILDRFNARARRVVALAEEEARAFQHGSIGTEHLLLGLIGEGEGIAVKALESLGISLAAVRQQVERATRRGNAAVSGQIPFTPRARKVLELSLREATQPSYVNVGTEHILLGLMGERDGVASQVLAALGADLNSVRRQVTQLRHGKVRASGGLPPGPWVRQPFITPPAAAEPTPLILDHFGRNLTRQARQGMLGPVIGQDQEIERVIRILVQQTRNNPVLVGGTGANRIVVLEGLAQKIVQGAVPDALKDRQLYAVDADTFAASSRVGNIQDAALRACILRLIAAYDLNGYEDTISSTWPGQGSAIGAQDQGKATAWRDAERQRLANGASREPHPRFSTLAVVAAVLEEARTRNVILFIDNLQKMASSAAAGGAIDATSIVAPMLTRGELQIVAAMGTEEYREHLEQGTPLSPYVQPIYLAELTIWYTIGMLKIAQRAATQARIPSGPLSRLKGDLPVSSLKGR